jgi:hypothetical protein
LRAKGGRHGEDDKENRLGKEDCGGICGSFLASDEMRVRQLHLHGGHGSGDSAR